jgi:hypothetical protein
MSDINASTGVGTLFTSTLDIYLNRGDEFQILFDADVTYNQKIWKNYTEFSLYKYDWFYKGDVSINLNNALPANYMQQDFLSDFLTYFNAYLISDADNTNHLLVKTFNKYFADLIPVDWTDKIADDQPWFFETAARYLSQTLEFTNTTDNNDYYDADYSVTKDPQPLYYLSRLNTSKLPNSGTDTVKVYVPPTTITYAGSGLYIPQIFTAAKTTISTARLLFATAVSNYASTSIFVDQYGALGSYIPSNLVSLSTYSTNDPTNAASIFLGWSNAYTYLDLGDGTSLSNNTVYNKFYKNELDMLLHPDTKMLTCQMVLGPDDIHNVLNKKVWISNPKIGDAWYRLNAVKNYTNSRSLCDVELIKIVNVPVSYESTIVPTIVKIATSVASINVTGVSTVSGGIPSVINATALHQLSDVTFRSLEAGNSLVYDAGSNAWTNGPAVGSVGNLLEASLGTDFKWNLGYLEVNASLDEYVKEVSLGSTFKWNKKHLDVSIHLNTLSDVSIDGVINDEMFLFDASLGKWTGKITFDASVYDVIDVSNYFWIFSDVSISYPVTGQSLVYDASWHVFENKLVSNANMFTTEPATTYFYTKPEIDEIVNIIVGGFF